MSTIRRRNPRLQGEIGFGAAIGWFSANGYAVSIPLCDNQPYDLVVDDGERLLKVQVKTTTSRDTYGSWRVGLQTCGGNQSLHTTKAFDNTASDLLFVLTDDGEQYLIPSKVITAKRAINLCAKYAGYRVSDWPMKDAPKQLHFGADGVVGEGFEPS